MAGDSPRFSLRLLGPFQFLAPNGERIGVSKKGGALIAMLAMSNDGERSRAWLEDKLWGSRQALQAQSSLRQELSNLRRLVNTEATPLLICERNTVKLDLRQLHVDAREDGPGIAPGIGRDKLLPGEFLEGLDLAGEDGFEEWLREQRTALKDSRGSSPGNGGVRDGGLRAANGPLELPREVLDLSKPAEGFGGQPALAVLPFSNLTGEPENVYAAEGFSEDLIDRLCQLRWLPVIARSSSFSITADDNDYKLIGRKLGAKYLLDGRLHRLNEAFWLSIGLMDAESGQRLWSQKFELPSKCSADVVEQTVTDLVAILDSRVGEQEEIRAHTKPASDISVIELIWRGRWHLNRFTQADFEIADKLFAEALVRAPDSPEALIQAGYYRGWCLTSRGGLEMDIRELRRLGYRAITADPEDGRSHMLAGIAEMWLKHPSRAKILLRRAIALNPSLAMAHAQLGSCHSLCGEADRGLPYLKLALRLNPNGKQIFYTLAELALAYYMLERWPDAIAYADEALSRHPRSWYAHMIKINALVRSGERRAANEAFGELLQAVPKFDVKDIEWLPFVDPKWKTHFRDGLKIASDSRSPSVKTAVTDSCAGLSGH